MSQPAFRCIEFVESVTEWMENALVDEGRLVLEEHIAVCPHCVDYVDQLRLATATLRDPETQLFAPRSPPPAARQALLDAFRREHGRP